MSTDATEFDLCRFVIMVRGHIANQPVGKIPAGDDLDGAILRALELARDKRPHEVWVQDVFATVWARFGMLWENDQRADESDMVV